MRAAKPVDLHIPEIGKEVERIETASGITLFIKEDHSAPSIEMSFSWLGGSNSAPVEELAPFELASRLLNEGGTEKLTPSELQARKDELGMSFSLGIGSTLGSGYFWSLTRNFEESFDLALEPNGVAGPRGIGIAEPRHLSGASPPRLRCNQV